MILSLKISLFFSIFVSLDLNSSTSAQTAEGERERKLNQNFINIDEKFKTIDEKMEQLESKGNDAFNFNEIIKNYTRLINDSNDWNAKRFEKMEQNFQKIEQFFNKTEFLVSHLLKAFNACDPNPCLYGGKCLIATTGSGYECDCSKFRSGINCKNFNCTKENQCFRLNDTVYVVIETSLTWTEAKVRCEEKNMTLAMPKDEERTRFLWNQLKPIYRNHYYLWIGLKIDEGMSRGQWKWVDGSALGEYHGGRSDIKSAAGLWFGLLRLNLVGSYMWEWYDATHQYYSICETRFSTN